MFCTIFWHDKEIRRKKGDVFVNIFFLYVNKSRIVLLGNHIFRTQNRQHQRINTIYLSLI